MVMVVPLPAPTPSPAWDASSFTGSVKGGMGFWPYPLPSSGEANAYDLNASFTAHQPCKPGQLTSSKPSFFIGASGRVTVPTPWGCHED